MEFLTRYMTLRGRMIAVTLTASALLTGFFPENLMAQESPLPGYTYTCHITEQTRKGSKAPVSKPETILRTETAGLKARIDVVSGGEARMISRGDYLITDDGGKTYQMYCAAKKTVKRVTMDEIVERGIELDGARLSLRHLKQTPGDTVAEEKIAEQTTKRARLDREYTLRVSLLLFQSDINVRDTVEVWCLPETVGVLSPGADYFTTVGSALIRKADAKVTPEVRAATTALSPGLPVKIVWTSHVKEGKEEPKETISTLEVRDFTRAAIAESRFIMPATRGK